MDCRVYMFRLITFSLDKYEVFKFFQLFFVCLKVVMSSTLRHIANAAKYHHYSPQTLRVKSKMASQRMKSHCSKMESALLQDKRFIAQLILNGNIESARIKVETLIRDENLMRVHEWLQMMCDIIHKRVGQITASKKECPAELLESICTLLFCANRLDIPELTEVCGQFKAKWGHKWFAKHCENRSGNVPTQVT